MSTHKLVKRVEEKSKDVLWVFEVDGGCVAVGEFVSFDDSPRWVKTLTWHMTKPEARRLFADLRRDGFTAAA